MKLIHKQVLLAFLTLTTLTFSCKDEEYLTDGGVHKTVTSSSNYDYLKSSGKFDTLLMIVDHFNLKDSLNEASTFFAFSDYSAVVFMRMIEVGSLEELYGEITSKFITQYMFSSKIALGDVSLQPEIVNSMAEPDAESCALSKAEYLQSIYLTNSVASFKYYQMQYLKINGDLDGSPNASPEDPADVTLRCQTSDIQTNSGETLIHVFSNNVTLRKI